jgi:hypothetical protein
MRTYKKIHYSKLKPADKARADYAREGDNYDNPGAHGTVAYDEYHRTYVELTANEPIVAEFIDGQRDCRDGVEHQSRSESYDRGYAAQYELEQMNTERTEMRGRR